MFDHTFSYMPAYLKRQRDEAERSFTGRDVMVGVSTKKQGQGSQAVGMGKALAENFAAARAVVKHAPEEDLSADEEQRFAESGLKNLRMVLGALNKSGATAAALNSLVDAAKVKGLNRKSFAAYYIQRRMLN